MWECSTCLSRRPRTSSVLRENTFLAGQSYLDFFDALELAGRNVLQEEINDLALVVLAVIIAHFPVAHMFAHELLGIRRVIKETNRFVGQVRPVVRLEKEFRD